MFFNGDYAFIVTQLSYWDKTGVEGGEDLCFFSVLINCEVVFGLGEWMLLWMNWGFFALIGFSYGSLLLSMVVRESR